MAVEPELALKSSQVSVITLATTPQTTDEAGRIRASVACLLTNTTTAAAKPAESRSTSQRPPLEPSFKPVCKTITNTACRWLFLYLAHLCTSPDLPPPCPHQCTHLHTHNIQVISMLSQIPGAVLVCCCCCVWCPGVPSDGPVLLQVEDSVALPPMTLCSSHHALDEEEQEYLELLNLPAGQSVSE